MSADWPRDEAPIERADWLREGVNPEEEAGVLPASAPRFCGPCEILTHTEVKPLHFLTRIRAPEIASVARPGQFLHIRPAPADVPLLRRPISICRIGPTEGWVEFLYRVVGAGTLLLSGVRPGERLDVMGPLGVPFRIDDGADTRHILVGGGVGIPPLLALAEHMRAARARNGVEVLLGGRTADLVLCDTELRGLGVLPRIATDDGSLGRAALVTELLDETLRDGGEYRVYACGPVPMLRAVDNVCRAHRAPCQVSFEARMACGLGACLSCVIPTATGYQRVCTEGPVFRADDVVWTAELNLH